MKYNSLVKSNRNFQSSINLQFDLNKANKIDTYIPTSQGISILKRYLNAVYNDSYQEDNATVLIGPYGRGKSHLLLILSALIRGQNDAVSAECLENLTERLSAVDSETGELARLILQRKKPVLTVIINSNHTEMNQSFILGLREALEREQLSDFFPKTYFEMALSMIATWETAYKNAFSDFKKILKEHKSSVKRLKTELNQCDRKAYHLFCEIYPQVTSGAEFNPMQNTDIIKMYAQVAEALSEQKQYGGIFIIFDEFSKFLESNAASSDMQNLKIIQDFAELATRSKLIHLCCVTHKNILDYSQSDSFRTVDGRFKKVYFVASAEQSYELVANALEHTEKFDTFYAEHTEQFSFVEQNTYRTGVFDDLDEEQFKHIILQGCFPLHPMTVYALIHISEKVGQNERTLFTFLSQSEEHTLQSFSEQNFDKKNLHLLTPDYLFDYFSELFRIEIFQPKIHSIWSKANTALKQTKDSAQQKLIKTIAVMMIVADEKMLPVPAILKAAVHISDKEFTVALTALQKAHILIQQRNSQLAFLTPNGVDIRKTIQNKIAQGIVQTDRPKLLQSAYAVPYLLPRQYNAEKCMMRYFNTAFMEASDFQRYQGDFHELQKNADGLLLYLIVDSQNEITLVGDKLRALHLPETIIVCVTENWKDNMLLKEYAASLQLAEEEISEDPHFAEELKLYQEDLFKSIQEQVNQIYSPLNGNVTYYNVEHCFDNIVNPLSLNRELSAICGRCYADTPVINNEMVNKNHLTAQIRKAREKLIDWLLAHSETIPMIEGYGPEVSLLRSTIYVKGLYQAVETDDIALQKCLEIIKDFAEQSTQRRVKFSEIYAVLTAMPFGMRLGIIPVYLAYVLRQHIDNLIVYFNDKEIELNGQIISMIEKTPEEYSFCIESQSIERENYLKSLACMFSQQETNACHRQYVVEILQGWFRALPKFARDCRYWYTEEKIEISNEIIAFRNKLRMFDLNPHELLFVDLPEIFGEMNLSVLSERIMQYKSEADSFMNNLKYYLIHKLYEMLDIQIEGSLCGKISIWYEQLSERTKKNVFQADVNKFLKAVAQNKQFDDAVLISKLAKDIEMIPLEDWNDTVVEKFIDDLKHILETVRAFEQQPENTQENHISIALHYDNHTYERNMEETEISGLAETVLNNIETTFEDYGEAVSVQERIAVLLKLLKKEIDQI